VRQPNIDVNDVEIACCLPYWMTWNIDVHDESERKEEEKCLELLLLLLEERGEMCFRFHEVLFLGWEVKKKKKRATHQES